MNELKHPQYTDIIQESEKVSDSTKEKQYELVKDIIRVMSGDEKIQNSKICFSPKQTLTDYF